MVSHRGRLHAEGHCLKKQVVFQAYKTSIKKAIPDILQQYDHDVHPVGQLPFVFIKLGL